MNRDLVKELLTQEVEALGFELLKIEFTLDFGRSLLRVYLDLQGGSPFSEKQISLDECATVNRHLFRVLEDKMPVVLEEYDLEVSSPGIDRPVERLTDFEKYEGLFFKVHLKDPLEGRKKFKGILKGVGEKGELVFDHAGEELRFGIQQLKKANLLYEESKSLRQDT